MKTTSPHPRGRAARGRRSRRGRPRPGERRQRRVRRGVPRHPQGLDDRRRPERGQDPLYRQGHPKAPGTKVTVQIQYEGKTAWKSIGTAKVKKDGTYSFSDKPTTRLDRSYRVVKPADKNGSKGISKERAVEVFGLGLAGRADHQRQRQRRSRPTHADQRRGLPQHAVRRPHQDQRLLRVDAGPQVHRARGHLRAVRPHRDRRPGDHQGDHRRHAVYARAFNLGESEAQDHRRDRRLPGAASTSRRPHDARTPSPRPARPGCSATDRHDGGRPRWECFRHPRGRAVLLPVVAGPDFDSEIKQLQATMKTIGQVLDLDGMRAEIADLGEQVAAPDLWDDQANATTRDRPAVAAPGRARPLHRAQRPPRRPRDHGRARPGGGRRRGARRGRARAGPGPQARRGPRGPHPAVGGVRRPRGAHHASAPAPAASTRPTSPRC